MADTSQTAASLRVSRVQGLSGNERLQVLTYLLAKYPEEFSELLDDALNAVAGTAAGSGDSGGD